MKVTFDSNTWRRVASPNNFPKDPIITDYVTIRESINEGTLIPFISETIFTLEGIKRHDRKQFFNAYKADIAFEENVGDDGSIKLGLKIGPNKNAHPGNNDFLKEHFSNAVDLGFNIIHLPRIGGIINNDIEGYRYKMDTETLRGYLNKVFEVAERINALEAGDYAAWKIARKYNPKAGLHGIGDAPDSENGVIANAVAEWADGDSVASHIAIGGDYFCTNDRAVSAGSKSVFSEANLTLLRQEYGFKTITPTDLASVIRGENYQRQL